MLEPFCFSDCLKCCSVIVGEKSSVFGRDAPASDEEDDTMNEQGAAVFSSSWLPGEKKYRYKSLSRSKFCLRGMCKL